MSKKIKNPAVPRNHVVVALIKRAAGSGAHIKSAKAIRRSQKISLMRDGKIFESNKSINLSALI